MLTFSIHLVSRPATHPDLIGISRFFSTNLGASRFPDSKCENPDFSFSFEIGKTKGRLTLLHGPCLQTHKVMIGWILCTPRLSEWSRLWPCLSFPSPRTRLNMIPLFRRSEEFRWFWMIIPSFLDSCHFSSVCSDLGRGNRESGKSEIIIQRNSKINEATKLIKNFISAKQLPIAV